MRSMLFLSLVIGTLGCKKDEALPNAVIQELPKHFVNDDPERSSKTSEIVCWSEGVKIYEGQAANPVTVIGDRIFHFREAGAAEGDGYDRMVRVTGDCVVRYAFRRE